VVPSPRLATASSRTQLLAPPQLLAAFMLAGVLALSATGGWVVRADAQPTLTVTIKSGADTETTYTVVAANFPANAAITETFGDGSPIAPATAQTNASGSLTIYWTLDFTNKYCGTVTAKTDTAQATTSFWVAPSTDPQSGTACDDGATGVASPTPNTAATAAAQTTTSATAAPTQAPIAQPTVAPAGSAGSGDLLHQVLGSRLLLLVAGGAVALVMIIPLLVLASTMRKSGQRKGSGRGRQPGTRNGGWNAPSSARQAAPGWRPQQAPRTPTRMAGAGHSDSRWRSFDDKDRDGRQGTPDPRWSRSQPGARGGRGPGGEGTAARIRTLRDFTEHRQSVRPPSREDDDWMR
jgi:hypothetical protein